jgi:hypothetical protein
MGSLSSRNAISISSARRSACSSASSGGSLAVERGLATCPQEVWANWPKTIAASLKLPDELMVFAGMSLGYEDVDTPLNQIRTAREPFEALAELRGFEPSPAEAAALGEPQGTS